MGCQASAARKGGAPGESSEDYEAMCRSIEKLMGSARAAEPSVTSLLESLKADFSGELSGLDNKFKSRESLLRKARKNVDRKRVEALNAGKEDEVVDIELEVWSTTDALRYTVLLPTERYVAAVKAAMQQFEEQGMVAQELKNFWPGGDNYQGINDVFKVSTDQSPTKSMLFEVQFHTPESFKSKSDSHQFYEAYRSSLDPEEKIKNWRALCDAARQVPVPDGVLDIPHPRNNPNPGELELYADLALKRAMKAEPDLKAQVLAACRGAEKVESAIMTSDELEATLDKMVDHQLTDSLGLQEAVQCVHEALTIIVVFPEESYAEDCLRASDKLGQEFTFEGSRNGWQPIQEKLQGHWKAHTQVSLGISISVCARGWDDGVAFTDDSLFPCMVTFHTPASLKVQEQLVQRWTEYLSANGRIARKKVTESIRQLHESVKVPNGARDLELCYPHLIFV
mmetsp:Transcript_35031/g.81292  ORF Transcript_35031/g.81292 Transcript_35031/m.81292 type:complete len:454 (-) Transcript_35031:70-1431(-)